MRLQKTHKMILAGLLAVALTIPAATVVKTVHASETQLPFAQSEDGTVHETSFDLARVSDEEELSSYEKDNGKHWVKLFSKFDGEKNILAIRINQMRKELDLTQEELALKLGLKGKSSIANYESGKITRFSK